MKHRTYWQTIWLGFISRPLGVIGLVLLAIYIFVALYAPFLASSKPLCAIYDGKIYFPLFRYLFSSAFFSKKIDLFFNLLGIFAPLYFATYWLKSPLKVYFRWFLALLSLGLFAYFGFFKVLDPANSPYLNQQKEALILQLEHEPDERKVLPSWDIELEYMNDYAKLNLVLDEYNMYTSHMSIAKALGAPHAHTLYFEAIEHDKNEQALLERQIQVERERKSSVLVSTIAELENRLQFIRERRAWLEEQLGRISFVLMPLVRNHHWEDDVGGDLELNLKLPIMEQSRINHKDLVAALIFGARISLFVGFSATLLALGIGIPLGLIAGYYGAVKDILLCRFVEVWEAMPVFFMLLLIVTILQTKSIFIVIGVLAIFSWMSAFRFVRAETFRQREMLYVDASKAIGFPDRFILCRHILPNALLAVLALLPFDIMGAITSEAGLAFLGLGEEQSCSWGVLMDEGRSVFPAESSLLWPPAIVLTILLVSIASVGQALHGALDPKSQE